MDLISDFSSLDLRVSGLEDDLIDVSFLNLSSLSPLDFPSVVGDLSDSSILSEDLISGVVFASVL